MPQDQPAATATPPPEPVPGHGPVATQSSDRPRSRATRFALIAIILVSTAIDFFFFTGYYASDDNSYFREAAALVEDGAPGQGYLQRVRMTLLLWNGLICRLAGFDVQVMAASFVFWHQLLNVLAFVLARRLFDRTTGLFAAYLVGTFPVLVTFSTCILPDIPLACFCVLTLLAFLRAYDSERSVGMATILTFVAGLCSGFAYLAKESGLVLLPFCFLLWIAMELKTRSVRPQRSWADAIVRGAGYPIGFFLMFAAESGTIWMMSEQQQFRLEWTTEEIDIEAIPDFHKDGGYDPVKRFQRAVARLSVLWYPADRQWMLVAGLVIFPFVRGRRWSVFLLGLWIFGYHTWGSSSVSHYYPPKIQARYLIPAFPFLLICLAFPIARWFQWFHGTRRFLGIPRAVSYLIPVGLVFIPLATLRGPNVFAGNLYKAYIGQNLKRAQAFVEQRESKLLVLSGWLSDRVQPLWYRGQMPDNGRLTLSNADAQIDPYLESDGFYYLEESSVRRYVGAWYGPRSINGLIHPAIGYDWVPLHPRSRRADDTEGVREAAFFAGTDADGPSAIRIDGRDMLVTQVAGFDRVYRRRTLQFAAYLGKGPEDEAKLYRKAVRSLDLFDVRVRNAKTVSETHRVDVMPSFREWRPDTETPLIWRVQRKGEHAFVRGADDAMTLSTDLSEQSYIWLVPRKAAEKSLNLRLPGDQCFVVDLEAEISGTVRVECVLSFCRDEQLTDVVSSRRVELINGKVTHGLYAPEERYLKPTFKVFGSGVFTPKRLEVRSFNPEQVQTAGVAATADVAAAD